MVSLLRGSRRGISRRLRLCSPSCNVSCRGRWSDDLRRRPLAVPPSGWRLCRPCWGSSPYLRYTERAHDLQGIGSKRERSEREAIREDRVARALFRTVDIKKKCDEPRHRRRRGLEEVLGRDVQVPKRPVLARASG